MHLLWLKSDFIVPPDTGGKIRTYNLLRELRKLCRVTYLSFRDDDRNGDETIAQCAHEVCSIKRREPKKFGAAFYGQVLWGMRSSLPFIVQKYRSPAFIAYQRDWRPADPHAVVLCDFLEMADNVHWSTPYPKVLFQHNVETTIWDRYWQHESHWWKKAYFNFERRRLARYERATCNRFDLVLTVSQDDQRRLQADFGVTRPVEVIETGVDTEFFSPRRAEEIIPGRLLFLGSLDWMPNIDGLKWFVEQVLPRIRQRHPQVTLDVVGRRPVAAVQQLSHQHAGIRIIPDVADVRPHIGEADLFVVPLRIGGGSRIKIYEAMAMRCPVVSTIVGAEGLTLEPDRHLRLAESPEQFARQVCDLLDHPGEKMNMASRGHEFVQANVPWSQFAKRLYELCLNLCQQPAKNRPAT